MKNLFISAALTSACALALAHDGHGLSGSHWHASDAWGFALIGAIVVALVWLRRGK